MKRAPLKTGLASWAPSINIIIIIIIIIISSTILNRTTAKQCWFADDATGAGPPEEVKQWWDELREAGPPLGYYPNSKKCWLVVKPEKEGRAKECLQERWAHGLILSSMWVAR